MIALLPLRGWVGDVMATQMAVEQMREQSGADDTARRGATPSTPSATKSIAAYALFSGAKSTFGHERSADHAAVVAPDCSNHAQSADADSADAGCANCAICQVCHTVGLTETASVTVPESHPETQPRASVSQFASAVAALGQKPPIS